MVPGLDFPTMRRLNKLKWIAILAPIIFYILIFTLLIGIVIALVRSLSQDLCGGWKGFITKVILVGEKEAAFEELCRLGEGLSGGGGASGGWCSTSIAGENPIPADKRDQYMPWVNDAADIYMSGDVAALVAIIKVESSWVFDAKNDKSTATGLGQFLNDTARSMKEFTGGDDGYTSVVWPKPTGSFDRSANDPRMDPKRSIYAAANYVTRGGKGNSHCTGLSGAEKWGCLYGYNHHTGLNDPAGSDTYKEGVKARDLVIASYNSLNVVTEECVGGSGGSIFDFAMETAEDIKTKDPDPKIKNMQGRASDYSNTPKRRSYCVDYGGAPWYADCGSFVGYIVSRTVDPDFPKNGTEAQFGYVTGGEYSDSGSFSGSKTFKTKTGKNYQVFKAKSTSDIQPGDILFANNGGHITIAGQEEEIAASLCSYGPMRKGSWYWPRMSIVARPLFGGGDGVAGNPDEILSCSGVNIQKTFLDFSTKYAGKTRLEHMGDYMKTHYGNSSTKLTPKAVVWHYTTSVNSSGPGIRDLFNGQESYSDEYPRPFAHFLIDKNGKIFQYASTGVTARHAPGVNGNSIGIEFSGNDESDILNNTKQYDAGLALTRCLMARNGIPSKNIVGHGEVGKDHPLYEDITGYDTGHYDWDNSMGQVRAKLK